MHTYTINTRPTVSGGQINICDAPSDLFRNSNAKKMYFNNAMLDAGCWIVNQWTFHPFPKCHTWSGSKVRLLCWQNRNQNVHAHTRERIIPSPRPKYIYEFVKCDRFKGCVDGGGGAWKIQNKNTKATKFGAWEFRFMYKCAAMHLRSFVLCLVLMSLCGAYKVRGMGLCERSSQFKINVSTSRGKGNAMKI